MVVVSTKSKNLLAWSHLLKEEYMIHFFNNIYDTCECGIHKSSKYMLEKDKIKFLLIELSKIK